MKLIVGNSYCRVDELQIDGVRSVLKEVLTYRNDIEGEKGQLFYQMKMFKKYGEMQKYHACLAKIKHLEETEYVCLYKDDTFPTGLLNIVKEVLKELKAEYQLVDGREDPGSSTILRWNNTPFEPRYYQKEMIAIGLKEGRGVMEAAVGSGKSLVMAYLIKELSVKSLIIVPSRGLSGQLYNDFSAWFGASNVKLLDAEKARKIGKPSAINIITVQSLASLQKSGDLAEFIKDIQAVYCDEVHHSGASTYTGLLKDFEHIYYRFGFTGTFLRNDNKTLEMWSFLSNVLYQYPAHKAISEGFLTPMQAHVYTLDGRGNKKYQKEYDAHYCGNPNMLQKVYEICTEINSDQQILILVNKKDKGGKIIHEYLNQLGVDNCYISGDNSKDEINDTIKAFNEKRIRVLIGSSVIGEGIDIRSTDHLIMCQGGKSEITMVQAIGRAIRLFEGKTMAYIHDFIFENTCYLQKHLLERVEIYQRNFNCGVFYH